MAQHRARAGRDHHRSDALEELAQHGAKEVVGLWLISLDGGPERFAEAFKKRSERSEALFAPCALGHGGDHGVGRKIDGRSLGDMEFSDPHQILELHPDQRVDVRLAPAVGGDRGRQLGCCGPRVAPRYPAEQFAEVKEWGAVAGRTEVVTAHKVIVGQ